MATVDYTLHTDSLLRKHHLLVLQTGWGDDATFEYVDWKTNKPASKKRIAAFEVDAGM